MFDFREFFKESSKPPSKTTVRRLGLAPNRKSASRKYYRGLISARPHSNSNTATLGEAHVNAHQCAARAR